MMKVDLVWSAAERAFKTFCQTNGELRTLRMQVSDDALKALGCVSGKRIDCSEMLGEDPGVDVIIAACPTLVEDEVRFGYD